MELDLGGLTDPHGDSELFLICKLIISARHSILDESIMNYLSSEDKLV